MKTFITKSWQPGVPNSESIVRSPEPPRPTTARPVWPWYGPTMDTFTFMQTNAQGAWMGRAE